MTFANEGQTSKQVSETCGLFFYRAEGPGSAALHRADQLQADISMYDAHALVTVAMPDLPCSITVLSLTQVSRYEQKERL